jgi:hypothetical protein
VSAGVGERDEERVGLCVRCTHSRVQGSAKGSRFWRCSRADHDERFRRYPPLPVARCDGFEAAGGGTLSDAG